MRLLARARAPTHVLVQAAAVAVVKLYLPNMRPTWSWSLLALTACGTSCHGGGNSHEESKLHAGTAPVLSPQDITTFERDGVLVVPTRAANSGGP